MPTTKFPSLLLAISLFLLGLSPEVFSAPRAVSCKSLFGPAWKYPVKDEQYGTFMDYYSKMIGQVQAKGPRGLARIRETIRKTGLTLVYDLDITGMKPAKIQLLRNTLGEGTRIDAEGKFAIKVVFASELNYSGRADGAPDPIYKRGVVLHIGVEPVLANLIQGLDGNISLGHGLLHGLFDNKVREAELVAKIDPKAMGKFVVGTEVLRGQGEMTALRSKLLDELKTLTNTRRRPSPQLTRSLETLALDFIQRAGKLNGDSFVKYAYESGTGDYQGMVTTFHAEPSVLAEKIVARFLKDLAEVRIRTDKVLRSERASKPGQKDQIPAHLLFDDPIFIQEMRNLDNGFTSFLNALLFKPEHILVQAKVPTMKLPSDKIAEYRVHFLDGKAIQVIPRNGYDYVPELEALAAKTIEDFFARKQTPAKYRYLMGGADVMVGPDGTAKIIELNAGASSGFMDGSQYPFLGATFVMNLVFGPHRDAATQNTPLLIKYEKLIGDAVERGDVDPLIQLIRKADRAKTWENYLIEVYEEGDIMDAELFNHVGRRTMERFETIIMNSDQPNAAKLAEAQKHLRAVEAIYDGLAAPQRKYSEIRDVMAAVRDYFQRVRARLP